MTRLAEPAGNSSAAGSPDFLGRFRRRHPSRDGGAVGVRGLESPLRERAAHVALLVLLFALSWTPVRALAGTVTLAWDPVASPALAGYRLHFGPSTGYYTGMIDVGNTTYVAVSDLPEGVTFHFAVSAYDWSGGSSGYSNDVAKTIPTTTPPGTPPPGTPPPPTPPPGTTPPGTAEVISVIEYYHAGFDHYFVTGIDDEIKKLDDGTIVGWQRTGFEFNAYAQASTRGVPVCRFFSTSFGAKSSHFYTPLAEECDTVQRNPDWQFEGEVFRVRLPSTDGTCGEGTTPVFRLYNDGQGGAPNHRYTTKLGGRLQMLEQRWVSEGYGPMGVMMCAPQ